MPHKQKTTYNFGVSLPIEALIKADQLRGKYISRSSWILMALENLAATNVNKKPLSFQVSRPRKIEAITPTPVQELTDNGTE